MPKSTHKNITIKTDGTTSRGELTQLQCGALKDLYRTVIFQEARGVQNSIADDLCKRIKDDPDFDRENLMNALHESCDGALIYTQDIAEYLMASRNDEAWQDVGVEEADAPVRAFYALQQDVIEELERRGVDVNADDLGREESSEDADESAGEGV